MIDIEDKMEQTGTAGNIPLRRQFPPIAIVIIHVLEILGVLLMTLPITEITDERMA